MDRFEWTGAALVYDANLSKLRAFQHDGAPDHRGWIQIMGRVARIAQFKEIEQTLPPSGGLAGALLQQIRWPPSNLADSPQEALARLHVLPGSHYSDPEFSWKFAVPPAGIGFLSSSALGPQYRNDLFAGAATPNTSGGYLFRFNLTGNRRKIAVDDPRLEDRVADNTAQERHHGERELALRHELRRRHGYRDRPQRKPLRGFPDAGRGLRDLPALTSSSGARLGPRPHSRQAGLQFGLHTGAIRFRRGRFSGRAASRGPRSAS